MHAAIQIKIEQIEERCMVKLVYGCMDPTAYQMLQWQVVNSFKSQSDKFFWDQGSVAKVLSTSTSYNLRCHVLVTRARKRTSCGVVY